MMEETLTKDFHFKAFNQTFQCKLKPRKDLYSQNFKLKIYRDTENKFEQVPFRRDQVFVGKCEGDQNSMIRGTFKGETFTGGLRYRGVEYHLEDAERHVSNVHIGEHMIVYRNKDMIVDKSKSFCGAHGADVPDDVNQENIVVEEVVSHTEHIEHRRYKRDTPSWNTCKILLVVDYKYYQNIGRNDIYDVALQLSGLMDRVDAIYRATQFTVNGKSYTGLGFEIGEIKVFPTPTTGFNKDTGSWQVASLLEEFSKGDASYGDYCVVHLFTYQSMPGNVLGLAYIGSPSTANYGGICSTPNVDDNSVQNTGFTTYRDAFGQTVLSAQVDLVTAHELGHNWGSNHDPGGSCSPSSYFGDGKYLMYSVSVSGSDPNNNKFSPCSRTSIGATLGGRGSTCFQAKTAASDLICGNGRVDSGEDCDGGFLGRFGLDECCNSDCTFNGASTCSPINLECCVNCAVASSGYKCRDDNGLDCNKAAYCDGSSFDCPVSDKKVSNEACLDEGQCVGGDCKSFCVARGKIDCACSEFENSCKRCCQDTSSDACVAFGNFTLPNGRTCPSGYCEDEVCTASKVGSVAMLFDLINNLSVDFVKKFFRQNLVGCVLVFSLFCMIPGSCFLTWLDKRKKRKLNRSENIPLRMDRQLTFDQDARKIDLADSKAAYKGGSPRYKNNNFTDLGGFGSDGTSGKEFF